MQNFPQDKITLLTQEVKKNPHDFEKLEALGIALLSSDRFEQSFPYLEKAVQLAPEKPHFWNNLGIAYMRCDDMEKALPAFEKSLKLNKNNPEIYNNLGNVYTKQKKYEQAISFFRHAIQIKPDFADAYNNLAAALMETSHKLAAYHELVKALTFNPNHFLAKRNIGKLEKHFGKIQEAKQHLEEVLEQFPNDIDTLNHYADVLRIQNLHENAISVLKKALDIDNNHAETHYYLGIIYIELDQYTEANYHLSNAAKAKELKIDILGYLAKSQLWLGEWHAFKETQQLALTLLDSNIEKQYIQPYLSQILFHDMHHQVVLNQQWAKQYDFFQEQKFPIYQNKHSKIKIGYISPDFTKHPIGLLLNDLFSLHDRTQFEVFGFPTCKHQTSLYQTIIQSFDYIYELDGLSPYEAAAIIHQQQLDLLIDLTGPTSKDNFNILALQPANIQCHLLGFVGSLQTQFIQYIITNPTTLPSTQVEYYNEKIAYLPHCDIAISTEIIQDNMKPKQFFSLPENKTIFLSHHAPYRLEPDILSAWSKILTSVQDSILWIYAKEHLLKNNIQQFLENMQVQHEQIIFYDESTLTKYNHHIYADIFLDTFHFTSCTCNLLCLATNTLVLTLQGDLPQNRVGVSYCNASGVTQQIAFNREEYIQKAIELGNNHQMREELKKQLKNKENQYLFNRTAYIKDLEAVYLRILNNEKLQHPEKIIYGR